MKDGKFGDSLSQGLTYGSDVPMDGSEVGFTAMPIPPMQHKKFGLNSGWPRNTGETESPGDLSRAPMGIDEEA